MDMLEDGSGDAWTNSNSQLERLVMHKIYHVIGVELPLKVLHKFDNYSRIKKSSIYFWLMKQT
jgi:hypothetical protein